MNKIKMLAAVIGFAFATNASAAVHTYVFGEKETGYGPKEVDFATLTFDDVDSKFTLSLANNFSTLFGASSAFVGSLALEYEGGAPYPVVTGTVNGGGVTTVTTSNGGGPGGNYDFRYVFGGGNDRLTSGETVSWFSDDSTGIDKKGRTFTIAAFDVDDMEEGALHVQGLGASANKSGWYEMAAVSPVPETDSYSMMLAGLGLMGFMVARSSKRKQNS